MSASSRRAGARSFEAVATILRLGTLLAVVVIATGLAWALATDAPARTDETVLELVGDGGPDAVIGIGLIGLALVPIGALAAAVVTFARAGERRPLAVAASVLVLVLATLVAAFGIGAPGA